jgi:hypothetical protein
VRNYYRLDNNANTVLKPAASAWLARSFSFFSHISGMKKPAIQSWQSGDT